MPSASRPLGAEGSGRRGRVSALYVFDPGPEGSIGDTSWIVEARARGDLPLLIVQGVLLSALARAADFVLPGASFVEKEASYTNDQGRLQGAARAIAAPGEAMEDWRILVTLASGLGVSFDYSSAAQVRADIAARFAARPELAGIAGADVHRGRPGESLAAGVESLRAMEVGRHVSGPAADQRIGRAQRAAAAARRHPVAGSQRLASAGGESHGNRRDRRVRRLGILGERRQSWTRAVERRHASDHLAFSRDRCGDRRGGGVRACRSCAGPAESRHGRARRARSGSSGRAGARRAPGQPAGDVSHPVEQAARSELDCDRADD